MKGQPDKPAAPMPQAVRRLRWWFLVPPAFMIVMMAAFWGIGKWEAARRATEPGWIPPKWLVLGIPLLYAPVMVVMFIGLARGMVRVRRAVKAAGGHACTGCLYDMRGAAVVGARAGEVKCPECGVPFDPDRAKASWGRARML